jgi:hypothetical protein
MPNSCPLRGAFLAFDLDMPPALGTACPHICGLPESGVLLSVEPMMILLFVIAAWVFVALVVALFIGRAVKVADRERARMVAQRPRYTRAA